jgi:hypothetical protein
MSTAIYKHKSCVYILNILPDSDELIRVRGSQEQSRLLFWPMGATNLVKRIMASNVTRSRRRFLASSQSWGDLPAARDSVIHPSTTKRVDNANSLVLTHTQRTSTMAYRMAQLVCLTKTRPPGHQKNWRLSASLLGFIHAEMQQNQNNRWQIVLQHFHIG